MANEAQKQGLLQYAPYFLPFAVFLVLTSVGNQFDNGPYIIYPIKTIITAALLFYYWKNYDEIKFNLSFIPVIVGIIVAQRPLMMKGIPIEMGRLWPIVILTRPLQTRMLPTLIYLLRGRHP